MSERNAADLEEREMALTDRDNCMDLAAISWAYRKLFAYGVHNVNMESALMMDRLNLMLHGGPPT